MHHDAGSRGGVENKYLHKIRLGGAGRGYDPIRNRSFACRHPNKTDWIRPSSLPFLLRSYSPPVFPDLAHATFYPTMYPPHVTPAPEDAAYEETTAQLATYSRGLFEFTLRLWSESRKRAEEIQRLKDSAASLNLSPLPQVRTGSMRSVHEADANSQQ